MKTVKEIVAEYLRANGYDGLVNDDNGCECSIDDLMDGVLCNGFGLCEPAYRRECNKCPKFPEDELSCGSDSREPGGHCFSTEK